MWSRITSPAAPAASSSVPTPPERIASTSQFYNPAKKRWAAELFDKLGLPFSILPEIVTPGTPLGSLLPQLADSAGLATIPVFATGSHDTASAVVAVPASTADYAYISSGTWSLMGIETTTPRISASTQAANFTKS